MTYLPPAGWVEPRTVTDTTSNTRLLTYGFFHTRTDCRHVRRADLLREVDKPYSAARCLTCAGD